MAPKLDAEQFEPAVVVGHPHWRVLHDGVLLCEGVHGRAGDIVEQTRENQIPLQAPIAGACAPTRNSHDESGS